MSFLLFCLLFLFLSFLLFLSLFPKTQDFLSSLFLFISQPRKNPFKKKLDKNNRYGNTSSSSIWYILARIESRGKGVRKGERVWQIAFGSGFKCNSAVWTALRSNRVEHKAWEPVDEEEILS